MAIKPLPKSSPPRAPSVPLNHGMTVGNITRKPVSKKSPEAYKEVNKSMDDWVTGKITTEQHKKHIKEASDEIGHVPSRKIRDGIY